MKKGIMAFGCAVLFTAQMAVAQDRSDVKRTDFFNHLDLSVNVGSTGVGFDLAAPVGEYVQLRAGATFMPTFEQTMQFDVQIGERDPSLTDEENQNIQNNRFEKLSGLLEGFIGQPMQRSIDMIGKPSYNNFTFMVDVFPLKNHRNWHVTAGFFLGSDKVAECFNTTYSMSSLVALQMYNNMYKRIVAEEPMFTYEGMSATLPPQMTQKVRDYGMMGMPIGDYKHDIIADRDIYWDYSEVDPGTGEYIHQKGDLKCAKGDVLYKKGERYVMRPGADNMVKADAKVNSFRPYIGIGYSGPISKDKKTSIGFDFGAVLWGGVPDIITHDGIDMVNDLDNVHGKVGDYISLIKKFPVYPVLNFRISQKLF